ncbi:MAG: rhodanese-like domain-containing protein, partial [Verrucomicrobiota bacterium]
MTISSQPMLSGDLSMGELLSHYPGARRALFRNFHIGGCSQCGFRDEETLLDVCLRNEQPDLDPVFAAIEQAHEEDERLLIEPSVIEQWLKDGKPFRLIDVRSREEHEAVSIKGSELFTQEISSALINGEKSNDPIVFYDHQGRYVLEPVANKIGCAIE